MTLKQRVGLVVFIAGLILALMQIIKGGDFPICYGILIFFGGLLTVLPDRSKT